MPSEPTTDAMMRKFLNGEWLAMREDMKRLADAQEEQAREQKHLSEAQVAQNTASLLHETNDVLRHGQTMTKAAQTDGAIALVNGRVDALAERTSKVEGGVVATGTHTLVRTEAALDAHKRDRAETGRHWSATAVTVVLAAVAIIDVVMKLKGH